VVAKGPFTIGRPEIMGRTDRLFGAVVGVVTKRADLAFHLDGSDHGRFFPMRTI
jgi:hypothetical protein